MQHSSGTRSDNRKRSTSSTQNKQQNTAVQNHGDMSQSGNKRRRKEVDDDDEYVETPTKAQKNASTSSSRSTTTSNKHTGGVKKKIPKPLKQIAATSHVNLAANKLLLWECAQQEMLKTPNKKWSYAEILDLTKLPQYQGRICKHSGEFYETISENTVKQSLISKRHEIFDRDDGGWYLKQCVLDDQLASVGEEDVDIAGTSPSMHSESLSSETSPLPENQYESDNEIYSTTFSDVVVPSSSSVPPNTTASISVDSQMQMATLNTNAFTFAITPVSKPFSISAIYSQHPADVIVRQPISSTPIYQNKGINVFVNDRTEGSLMNLCSHMFYATTNKFETLFATIRSALSDTTVPSFEIWAHNSYNSLWMKLPETYNTFAADPTRFTFVQTPNSLRSHSPTSVSPTSARRSFTLRDILNTETVDTQTTAPAAFQPPTLSQTTRNAIALLPTTVGERLLWDLVIHTTDELKIVLV